MNKFMSLFRRLRDQRNVDLFISGQKGSGVSSVASALAGIKPESDPVSTNGAQNWFFKKGRYSCNLTEFGNQDRQLKWGNFVWDSHALVYVVNSHKSSDFEKDRQNLANLASMEGIRFRSLLIVLNKYGELESLRKSELKDLIGFSFLESRWHGMIKIVKTRAINFKRCRPSGIWKGLKFLLYNINCTYDDLKCELEDYHKKTATEVTIRREKRQTILENIRNDEVDNEAVSSKPKAASEKDTEKTYKLPENLPVPPIKSTSESSSSQLKIMTEKTESKDPKATAKSLPALVTKTSAKEVITKAVSKATTKINDVDKPNSKIVPAVSEMTSTACGDATRGPMSFNINIVVNDEILTSLMSHGLTMTINLATN